MDFENSTLSSSNKGLEDHPPLTRSPLKDFTNTPRFEESGGVLNKNNAAGSGNEEDLKKDSKLLLESADKLSQGSLPSTPTRSVVDTDTTTDYESADEGQAAVDFSLLAHNLEQVHLSTPSEQSRELQDHQLKPAEKTIYLSSPDSDDFNLSYKTVIEKTLYQSVTNFSDGSPSDENSTVNKSALITKNKSNSLEVREIFNKKSPNQDKGNSFEFNDNSKNDKIPEIAHDSVTCIEETFYNIDISPIEFVEPFRTPRSNDNIPKVKFISPLSDLDKSFSGDHISVLSSDLHLDDIQLSEESLNQCSKAQSINTNDKNDEQLSFFDKVNVPLDSIDEVQVPLDSIDEVQVPLDSIDEVQVPLDSIDEVQVPLDNQLDDNEVDNDIINVNLSVNSYFLNVGNISNKSLENTVEIASEAQEINSDITSEKVEINIENVNIEKPISEELTSLEDIKIDKHSNDIEIIEPKSAVSIEETLDLKLSENSINKNTSVSDDLQSVKDIQGDFDSLIYNDVENEIISKDNLSKCEGYSQEDNSEKVNENDKESLVDISIEKVNLSACTNINVDKTLNEDLLTQSEIENHKNINIGNEDKSLNQEINFKEEVTFIKPKFDNCLETLSKEVIKQVDITLDNAIGIVLTNNSKIITDNETNDNNATDGISIISTERILPVQVENQSIESVNFDNSLIKENDKLCSYLNTLNISDKKENEEKEFSTNLDQVDTKLGKPTERDDITERLSADDKRNISEPINLSIKEHNKHIISPGRGNSFEENTKEEIVKDSSIIKSHSLEDKRDLSSSLHESTSLNSPLSKELLQSQVNRSYRDLTELIATCSKQERELAGKEFIESNEKVKVSFKEQVTEISKDLPMAEDTDDQEVNQHMMQPTPSVDINNSEAGPITADEDFHKGEFFQEATAIDFSLTPARLAPSLTRKSLYIRFDPLIEAALSSEAAVQESRDNNVNSVTAEMADTKFGESGDVEKTPKKDRNLKDSQTLIMINTPGGKTSSDLSGSEKLNNLSPSTPNNSSTKRTLGSGGTPSLRQEVSKLQDLMIEQEQAYVEQLAEKNEMIGTLRSRVTELEAKEPRGDLEEKLKSRETEAVKMRKELNENILMNKQLLTVMEEYEKAIASSVRRREDERNEFEKIKEKIAGERDTALQHLTNMEVAFNDIHLKYERCKSLIETLHNNEKQLKQTIEEQEKVIEQQKQSYAILKQHATEKVNEANQEIAAAHKSYQAEIAKMKAMSKKAELKVKSLEESLEQKKKEVKELTQICDELIGKVSGQ